MRNRGFFHRVEGSKAHSWKWASTLLVAAVLLVGVGATPGLAGGPPPKVAFTSFSACDIAVRATWKKLTVTDVDWTLTANGTVDGTSTTTPDSPGVAETIFLQGFTPNGPTITWSITAVLRNGAVVVGFATGKPATVQGCNP